jgi:protocatechuate 3,4-dioxygenase beta subunit
VNYLDLHFKGGVEVRGRVSDATGEAVPGAVVRLSPAGRAFGGPETITDAGGEYRMPGVQDGGYRLWVQAPGYAAFRGDADVHVEGQPVHGLDVQLEVGARIRGRVSGLEPERLGDVTVRAEGGSFGGFGGVGVDSSGGFRIENLEPGGYSVVATVANSGKRASGEVEIEPGATEVALDLAFEAGLTLSGRAVQADEPVRGATVYVEGRNVRHSGWNETDHDGRFEIDGLEPGDYDVRLRHWQTGLAYDEPIGLTVSRKILLDVPTARVGGRVVDATDHEPLAGATLSLVPDGPTSSGSRRSMHSATSDLEGKFELGNVGDGGFTLTASKQGYAASTRSVVVQSGRTVDDLQLALDPTEGVTLEVRLPTGTPPAEVSLAVLEASGGTLLGGTYATGENGRVRLSSVPPGRWTAVISAAGAATSRVEVQAPGPAVPVALQPVTSLRVRVPELAGATVATIRLSDGGGHPHYGLDWTGRAEREWQMQGGSASFDRLPPGDWTVSVTAPDGRSWQGTQATASGGVAELTLE